MHPPKTASTPLLPLSLLLAGLVFFVNGSPFFRDSPEFITSFTVAGVSHPTGFPAIHLLAQLFVGLPIGSIPFRLGLLMLFSIGWTAACLAWTVSQVSRHSNQELPETWLSNLLPWAAALCLPLLNTVWFHWSNIEVYVPSLALSATLIAVGADAMQRPDPRLRLPLLALLSGLSLGFHVSSSMLALLVDGFVLWTSLRKRPASFPWVHAVSWSALMAAGGALAVLYVPLRAGLSPAVNWGNPSSLAGFASHISGRSIRSSFSSEMMQGDWAHILANTQTYLGQMLDQTGPMLAFSALAMVLLLTSASKRLVGTMLGTLLLSDAAFSIFINPMAQSDRQTSTLSLTLLCLTSGIALQTMLNRWRSRLHDTDAPIAPWGVALVILLTAVTLTAWPVLDLEGSRIRGRKASHAYAMGLETYRSAQPDSLVVTTGDDLSGMMMYLESVEIRRPDILPVIHQMLCDPSLTQQRLERHPTHPAVPVLESSTRQHCTEDTRQAMQSAWAHALASLGRMRTPTLWELGSGSDGLLPGGPIAVPPVIDVCWEERPDDPRAQADRWNEMYRDWGSEAIDDIGGNILAEALRLQATVLQKDAMARGYPPTQACSLLVSAAKLSQENCRVRNNLAVCLMTLGRVGEAAEQARTGVDSCPLYLPARTNLVLALILAGKAEAAALALIEMSNDFPSVQLRPRLESLRRRLNAMKHPQGEALVEAMLRKLARD